MIVVLGDRELSSMIGQIDTLNIRQFCSAKGRPRHQSHNWLIGNSAYLSPPSISENLILHMLSEESQQQQQQRQSSHLTPSHREGRSSTPPATPKSTSGHPPPRPSSPAAPRKTSGGSGKSSAAKPDERSLTMQIAQMFLSSLHAWGLDPDLDHLCIKKLGLLRPGVRCSLTRWSSILV